MSIVDLIKDREAQGRLALVKPMIQGLPHPRLLYAGPDLQAELAAILNNEDSKYRGNRLLADLDAYSTGEQVTVSRGREKYAMFKQLEPRTDEVWTIRSRDPKPSIRVFGRFAEANVFIATHLVDRPYLGAESSREWRDEILRCKSEWRKLFATFEPVSSEDLNDYFTEDVVDLGFLR